MEVNLIEVDLEIQEGLVDDMADVPFILAEESLGYVTAPEESNIDFRLLVAGSQNVLIDQRKKTSIRAGYTRLGAANTSLTAVRNANKEPWDTSTGTKIYWRFYDDELEVYLGTVDGIEVNAWTRVRNGWITTERLRETFIYDSTENIDFMIMVNGDDKLYRWNGAVITVKSASGTSIVKNGSETWAQARFYTNGNKTLVNPRTGNEHTYTGGETTTTLTGLNNITGIIAGDVLIQKVVTNDNKPEDGRNNHTIGQLNNQIYVGSDDSEEVFVSKDSDYTDFTFSSPRLTGEGALLTLTDTTRGFSPLGNKMIIFSGRSTIFKTVFQQLDIGGVLTETLDIEQLNLGVDQGALIQEAIVPIGDAIWYLTNEVTLRAIQDTDNLTGINPKTFSNPIKPDFDAEDWFDSNGKPNAFGFWHKNILFFSAPESSRLYMLNFIQDADGKLKRYWNPPQILPVGAMSVINSGTGNDLSNGDKLHIHSNTTPETYLAFDGGSDGQFAGMAISDKLPISAKAIFAYNNYKKRGKLKNFDEYYVYGEITPNTIDLILGLNYDFDGTTQQVEKIIDGSDNDILEGAVGQNSLAQQSLAINPLGGLLVPPEDARKFRLIFEIAREDFFELQAIFSSNEVDRFWSIIAHGANSQLSRRKPINLKR